MIFYGYGCPECCAPPRQRCDEACPTAVTVDHERIADELDAYADDQLQDLIERTAS